MRNMNVRTTSATRQAVSEYPPGECLERGFFLPSMPVSSPGHKDGFRGWLNLFIVCQGRERAMQKADPGLGSRRRFGLHVLQV